MSWNIAQAKQRFSEVVRLTAEEPQVIYNRSQPVAAVIGAKDFEAFEAWKKQQAPETVASAFAELRRIAAEEGYELDIPPRSTIGRPNAFVQMLDEEESAGQ